MGNADEIPMFVMCRQMLQLMP